MWDLKSPPEAVLKNEQRLGLRVIERAAADLAATFNVETITAGLSQALASMPHLAELRERLAAAQDKAADVLAGVHLPHLPTQDEVRARASTMFVSTRSLDRIVDRAHQLIMERVGARLASAAT